jgi:hypothetical protein
LFSHCFVFLSSRKKKVYFALTELKKREEKENEWLGLELTLFQQNTHTHTHTHQNGVSLFALIYKKFD